MMMGREHRADVDVQQTSEWTISVERNKMDAVIQPNERCMYAGRRTRINFRMTHGRGKE